MTSLSMADTLFGYSIPFPTYDLYVAITAVALYIPSIILVNYLANKGLDLVSRKPKTA